MILGINGSPIEQGNTERLVKYVLENANLEYELINLRDFDIKPCKACLTCAKTNICTFEDDDWHLLSSKVVKSDAFVIGGWPPYDMLDARTKAFLERTFCLRHSILLNEGKFGVAIVTGTSNPDKVADDILEYYESEGIIPIGKVVSSGIDPCWSCGLGDNCVQGTPLSMVRERYRPRRYPYGDRLPSERSIKLTPEIVPPRVEEQPEVMKDAKRLGKLLFRKLEKREEKRKILLERIIPGSLSMGFIDRLITLTEKSQSLHWTDTIEEVRALLSLLQKAKSHAERKENRDAIETLLEFARIVLYRTNGDFNREGSEILMAETRRSISDLYDF